ncbi:MAG: septum formation initiator family protein [Patescibacteria group bacterium]
MITNFRKNKSKNLFHQVLFKFGGILILIIALLLIIADVKIYQKKKQLNYQIESLKNKIQDLKSRNSSLKEGILNADKEQYIEKIAREELNLQKPGEKVISFVATESKPDQNSGEKKGILEVWLGWLSRLFSI